MAEQKPEYGFIDSAANFFREMMQPIKTKGKGRAGDKPQGEITGGEAGLACSTILNRHALEEELTPAQQAKLQECLDQANPGAAAMREESEGQEEQQ